MTNRKSTNLKKVFSPKTIVGMFFLILFLGAIAGFLLGRFTGNFKSNTSNFIGVYPSSTSCLTSGEFAQKVSDNFQTWYSTCVVNGGGSGNGNNRDRSGTTPPGNVPPPSKKILGIWISPDEIKNLPTSSGGWDNVDRMAKSSYKANLKDQISKHPLKVLAMAYKAVRLNDDSLKRSTVREIYSIKGTDSGARALAIGRNMMAYVVAADLLNYRPGGYDPFNTATDFVSVLRQIQNKNYSGKTLKSCHAKRPNNWGTMCGASRIAIDLYLNDKQDLEDAVKVFKGYLGDKSVYNGFIFNTEAEHWTCEKFTDKKKKIGLRPVAPPNCFVQGHDMSGAPIDDVQRVEDDGDPNGFKYPIPDTHYAWGGFSAAVAQAEMLYRAGYTDAYNWQQKAIWRGMNFLNNEMPNSDSSPTYWMPWIVNKRYNLKGKNAFPTKPNNAKSSRLIDFTDWTHAQ